MDKMLKARLLDYYYSKSDKNQRVGKMSGIKIQKFLFFYNVFSYLDKKDYTDKLLYAYPQGPVYVDVMKSYIDLRDTKLVSVYFKSISSNLDKFNIDSNSARVALRFVDMIPDNELSVVTHNLETWLEKYSKYINDREKSVFTFNDFTKHDIEFLSKIKSNFSDVEIDKYVVRYSDSSSFLIEKENYNKIINLVSGEANLCNIVSDANPVYLYMEGEDLYID